MTATSSEIPRINAVHLDSADTRKALRHAARTVGFLTLHNTAIPTSQVRGLIGQYAAFFAQPEGDKRRLDMARTGSNRGWGASGAERVDPKANPDWKQVFDMGFTLPPDDPLARHGLTYYAENLWPDGLPQFRSEIEEYYVAACDVSLTLLQAIAAAVDMPGDAFTGQFDRPMALLRGNYYPARPEWAGEMDYGIAPHTDYGCLTLLATDGTPGLEVQDLDGGWIPVSAPPGEFIVNFGEMLEMWTAGQIVATPHRVIGGPEKRISVPLFFNPNYDTDVSPPGSATPILAGDHLSRRYDETYLHMADSTA